MSMPDWIRYELLNRGQTQGTLGMFRVSYVNVIGPGMMYALEATNTSKWFMKNERVL